ncbi:MAG: Gfo/Idh/MocA family protein [Spirochaetaceae bacterium]
MKYGFGIVGLGMIADFHAKAITDMEGGHVAACYSRSREKALAFGKKYGCTGYTNYREFLAHQGLDIVSICTPSGLHLEQALEAAEAGKHIIVEKPLEVTLKRCDAMIEGADRNGVVLAGIFPSRFHEVAGVIKEAVEEKRFGRLTLGDAYVKWFRSQEYYDKGGWKGTWKYDGGGALMNQSIHAIDLLQWFMGPVASVQAATGTLAHDRIEVEDTAAAVLTFENGAIGVIEGTTSVYPGFLKRIELSGNRGSVVLEEEDLKLWQFEEEQTKDEEIRKNFLAKTSSGGGASDPSAIGYHGHRKQFEDLCMALDNHRSPLVDGREARKAVEIILAIYESAKTGKRIDLPLE